MNAFKALFWKLLGQHWVAIHEDAMADARAEAAAGRAPRPLDWRPLVVLVVVAVSLTLQEYWGERAYYAKIWPAGPGARSFFGTSYWELGSFGWWTGWRVFGYLILPAAVVLCLPGERLRDYGLSFRGFMKHAWIYVVLFLAILPLVVWMSTTAPFQKTYPFYKLANRSNLDFWAWQGLYALQFLALEFFFRGFMLHGLKKAIGVHAIWVMCVPYCMIHYGKPMPETLGAIFAGVILGTLAMRTKSIWCGVLIHVSVAITMDLLAVRYCPATASCLGH